MDEQSESFTATFDDPRVSASFCRHLRDGDRPRRITDGGEREADGSTGVETSRDRRIDAGPSDRPTHADSSDRPTHADSSDRPTDADSSDRPTDAGPSDRSTDAGSVTLVGVVHDHPASVGRVEAVLERREPDVLALELPTAAVGLYRSYADEAVHADGHPRFGGEMSAAIRTAPAADVVGIDAPSWSFCRRLAARLVADRARPSTARRLLTSLGAATRQALTCRLAASLNRATSLTVAADDPISYDCSSADPAARQAEHERAHVAGVQALLASADGGTLAYRDETREACMLDRLRSCRREGDVVAVVGIDHLEALEKGLAETDRRAA